MKPVKYILILFLGILIIPIFSLFVLSFGATGSHPFKWYAEILANQSFISAFSNSFTAAVLVSVLTVIVSFILSLSYFDRLTKMIVVFFILFMGLMPPDIISIAINRFALLIGFNRASSLFLYFGLLIYCLPFGIIILWARYFFIDKQLFVVSEDLGLTPQSTVLKILLPLSGAALTSVVLISFLLTFNEYPRTYYLSGSDEYLSEFLNGKLSSGTDNSVYAGGSISIMISIAIIVVYSVYAFLKKRKTVLI